MLSIKTKAKTGGKTIPSTTNQHCTATTNWKLVVTFFFFLPWERERERIDSLLLTSDSDDEKQHETRLRV